MIRSDIRKIKTIEQWVTFATWKAKQSGPGHVVKTPEMIVAAVERDPPPSFCGIMTTVIASLGAEGVRGGGPFSQTDMLNYAKRVFTLMQSFAANLQYSERIGHFLEYFPTEGPDPAPDPAAVASMLHDQTRRNSYEIARRLGSSYRPRVGVDPEYYLSPELNKLYIKAYDFERSGARFGKEHPLIERRIEKLENIVGEYLSDPVFEAPRSSRTWKDVFNYVRCIWPVLREIMILAYFIERFDGNPMVRPSSGFHLPISFPMDADVWNWVEETYGGSFNH